MANQEISELMKRSLDIQEKEVECRRELMKTLHGKMANQEISELMKRSLDIQEKEVECRRELMKTLHDETQFENVAHDSGIVSNIELPTTTDAPVSVKEQTHGNSYIGGTGNGDETQVGNVAHDSGIVSNIELPTTTDAPVSVQELTNGNSYIGGTGHEEDIEIDKLSNVLGDSLSNQTKLEKCSTQVYIQVSYNTRDSLCIGGTDYTPGYIPDYRYIPGTVH